MQRNFNEDSPGKRDSMTNSTSKFNNVNDTFIVDGIEQSRRSPDKSRESISRSSFKKPNRESSAHRKSVSFKQLVNNNTERNRPSSSNRNSLKKSRRSSSRDSPSFGANNSIYDDTADFEELDYVDSIPTEGKRSLLRSSGFSATKDKTRKNNHSFFSPNRLNLANHERGYR